MSGLPKGWATTTLIELLTALESGSRPRGGVRGISEGVPSIGGEHLNYDGSFNLSSVKYVPHDFASNMSRGLIKRNDILIVKDGATTGKTAYVDSCFPFNRAVVNEHVFLCRSITEINPRFLFRFLMSKEGQERILENFKGSAQGGINQSFAQNTEIPIAPLNEQRRIIAKLEELLAKVDASQQRLAKIPVILKRFRQAVLAAACSGRLTADWREGLGLGAGEELPDGWGVTTLGKLASLVTSGSRGWAQYYSDAGSVFIRAQNINSDFLDLSDIAYVSLPNKAEGLRTKVQKDDLLVTITGANVTKSARVIEPLEDAYVSQHVALVRMKDVRQSPFVIMYMTSASHGRAQLLEAAYGQGKPGLNLDNVRSVTIFLPPLPEQQEIVRRVEAFFTLADQLEANYRSAKAHVDRLTQSILAKAFRGELVPQDPTDEPASVLLERIRAERAKTAPAPRSKVTPRPAQKTYTPKPEPLPLAAEPPVAYGSTIPQRILSAMQPSRDYSRAEVTAASGITDAEWLWAIRQLKEEGKVRQTGERRGARYRRT